MNIVADFEQNSSLNSRKNKFFMGWVAKKCRLSSWNTAENWRFQQGIAINLPSSGSVVCQSHNNDWKTKNVFLTYVNATTELIFEESGQDGNLT